MYEDTIWTFETANFTVELRVSPEDMDPADSFEFDEDIEMVRNGDVEWFCARIVISKNGHEIGSDCLGGCAYKTFEELYTSHRDRNPMNRNCTTFRAAHGQNVIICHCFPSMVREAIADARRTLAS